MFPSSRGLILLSTPLSIPTKPPPLDAISRPPKPEAVASHSRSPNNFFSFEAAASDRLEEFLVPTRRLDRCLGYDRFQQPPPGDPEEEEEEDDGDGDNLDGDPNSNYCYDEAEALTKEIEEETQTVGEVLRIKRILDHHQDKATEIGRAVNRLRKHNHKEIRQLVKMLIDGWKLLVDEWVNVARAIPSLRWDRT